MEYTKEIAHDDISKLIPALCDSEIDQLVEYMDTRLSFYKKMSDVNIDSVTLDPSKLNIVNVDTGRLPRSKALSHLQNISELFKNRHTGDMLDIIFMAKSADVGACNVIPIEKDKAYIVEVPVSYMSNDASKYVAKIQEMSSNLTIAGYTVQFVAKYPGLNVKPVEEYSMDRPYDDIPNIDG